LIFLDTNVISETLRKTPNPAVLAYGDIMSAALRQGRPMTAPDGMIAAIAHINEGRLATRNLPDFETIGLELGTFEAAA
jgi:predicted nucleic acid-binding protein